MTGRVHGRSGGRSSAGGRFNPSGRGGRGGRSANMSNNSNNKTGLTKELEGHIFDFGTANSADKMKTTQEKIADYVGIKYGDDVANELINRVGVILAPPEYPAEATKRYVADKKVIEQQRENTLKAKKSILATLESQLLASPTDTKFMNDKAVVENEIIQLEHLMKKEIPIELTKQEEIDHNNKCKAHSNREEKLISDRKKVFTLIKGQCTQQLKDEMKSDNDWEVVNKSYDPIKLYKLMERAILKHNDNEYIFATAYEQEMAVRSFKQGNLSNTQYVEKFNTRYDVAKSVGVEFGYASLWEYCAKDAHKASYDSLMAAEQQQVREDAEERYISYILIHNSSSLHESLRTDLLKQFSQGDNKFPTTRPQVLQRLNTWSKSAPQGGNSEGTAFAQKGGKQQGGKQGGNSKSAKAKSGDGKKDTNTDTDWDPADYKDRACFKCGKKGHPKRACPDLAKSSTSKKDLSKQLKEMTQAIAQMQTSINAAGEESSDEEHSHFQIGGSYTFTQVTTETMCTAMSMKQSSTKLGGLDLKQVILLDSQSTVCLFCNPKLVMNIRKADDTLLLKSNGGSMTIGRIADVEGFTDSVWYSKRAITNILSLAIVGEQYHITYDSHDAAFIVHRQEFGMDDMVFKQHKSGLHYYDPRGGNLTFVTTVEGNKSLFTKRQVAGAERARNFYSSISHPGIPEYKWMVRYNQFKDCPVTIQDVETALKIWGPNIAALKGKTVRKTPEPVVDNVIQIPKEIRELHSRITLVIDIFFINGIPYFLTLGLNIYFTTVSHLKDRKLASIEKALTEIVRYYTQRGFNITTVMADGEFAPLGSLMTKLPGAPKLNLASANEHEPFVERRIRVVKERVRSLRYTLPFKTLPKNLLTHMVFFVVKLLNYFPAKGGVSDHYSPKAIMSGEVISYKQYSMPFGTYCQVHEQDTPRNSLAARTQGAISLGPSNNVQGGQKFYTLDTGKVVTRYSWTVIPMPTAVIDRVNELSKDQPTQLTFEDRQGRPIGDNDAIVYADDSQDYEFPGVPAGDTNIPGVHDGDTVELPGVDTAVEPTETGVVEPNEMATPTEIEPQVDELDTTPENEPTTFEPSNDYEAAPVAVENAEAENAEAAVTTNDQPTVQPRRSGRSTKGQPKKHYEPTMQGKKYSFAQAHLLDGDPVKCDPSVVAMIMTQLSLKSAVKEWGDEALFAAKKEMKQLHWRNSFKPVHYKDLSEEQRRMILESFLFVTRKRSGELKARKVAGGNKQRDFVSKEEASSPTVSNDSTILSCTIDAKERRQVATIDIPNAFIQTKVVDDKRKVIVRIRGPLVDMLVEIAPEVYSPYVTYDKHGNKQLLVECQNALYGTMVASLLYYEKFTASLKSEGYEMNPYDPCVWNKTINGKQCTILFHVDDCKISHVESKVLDDTIAWLRRNYESIFEDGSGEMKVHRGLVHKYLGMTLDFSTKRQVKITMTDYVTEIVEAWDKAELEVNDGFIEKKVRKSRNRTSAAPEDLFKIDEDAAKLPKEQATKFHNIVAKALYVSKRARPDTSVAIAFLTTRVREPDVDDWKKLKHLMDYLRATKDLPLILGADNTGVMEWFVDASFAVHPNMRGHTGGGLTLGRGFPIVNSTKQKLNTRSSTESELVGVDDMMPTILWSRYFLKAQGYDVTDNIIYQDNQSAILLERNGKASSSKRTKHIAVRYFFITNRIQMGEVRTEWCPTEDMVSDFMTKPLQGSTFTRFRDLIMGAVSMKDMVKSGKAVKSGRGNGGL